jgi:xylulokinase
VERAGNLIAQASLERPLAQDERGFSEMDPEGWWADFSEAVRRLLDQAPAAQVAGLCLGGLTRTQVFLDQAGQAVRPAITWADSRAGQEAELIVELQAGLGLKTWGPVNAFHTLARLLWLKEHEPESFARLALVLEPKDFIVFRLIGRPVGDLVSLARLLTPEGRLPKPLWARLGLPLDLLPPLFEPQARAGLVQAGLPEPLDRLAGRPVFVGSMDAWLAAVGLGALDPGQAFDVSGTSEVLGLVTARPVEAPGLVTLPWGQDRFQIGGPSQAGADCLAWLAEATGREVAELSAEAAAAPSSAEPLLFLPYLRGERTPLWEPDARGLFVGLSRSHGRADLTRAVVEGVALANRQVLSLAEGAAGAPAAEIRLGGGAARSALWAQVKADVLGRPVLRTACPEAGLLGAAMVALAGLGEFDDLAQAVAAMVQIEAVHDPDPARTGHFGRLFELWREAQAAGLGLTKRLVDLGRARLD